MDETRVELKPCPFCNALTAVLEELSESEHRVKCQECGLQTLLCITPESAVGRWNTRPTDPGEDKVEAETSSGEDGERLREALRLIEIDATNESSAPGARLQRIADYARSALLG
jgi:hypothetical protein